ncbi:UNVERIFIED_CONTAM: hypothetical protein NCL1_60556 [Trichonephila clavipes]
MDLSSSRTFNTCKKKLCKSLVISTEKSLNDVRSQGNSAYHRSSAITDFPLRPNQHYHVCKKISNLTIELVCRKCKVLLFINRRWLWSMFYFQLVNLALFSNTTKIRLLFICRKKDSGFRCLHDRAGWALLKSLQLRR